MQKKKKNAVLVKYIIQYIFSITLMIGYIGYFYSSMANFRSGYADFQIANRVTILDAQNFDEGSKNELRKGNLLQDLQVSNKIANSIKARCLPKEIKIMDNFIRIVDNQRFCEKIKVDQRKDGRLLQQIGHVLDIGFPLDKMPKLYNTLIIKENHPNGDWIYVICEALIMLENNRVYAKIVMQWGNIPLKIGMEVFDTKVPLSVLKGNTETFTLKDGRRTLYIPDIRMTEIRAKLKNKKPLTRLERFLLISFGIHLCILKAVNYYIK